MQLNKKDQERLKSMKRRYRDMLTNQKEDVKLNRFVMLPIGDMVNEPLWLIEKLEAALKGAAPAEEEESEQLEETPA